MKVLLTVILFAAWQFTATCNLLQQQVVKSVVNKLFYMNPITKRPSGSPFVLCLLLTGIVTLYAQTEFALMKTVSDKKTSADQQDKLIQQLTDSLHKEESVHYRYR